MTRVRKFVLASLFVLALTFQFAATLAGEPVSYSSGSVENTQTSDGLPVDESFGTIPFRGF